MPYDSVLPVSASAVAISGSLAAIVFAERLRIGGSKTWWLFAGALVFGLTLWVVQFTALLAMRLPVLVALDVPLLLLSIEPVIVASSIAMWLARDAHLPGARCWLAAAALAAGAGGTTYFAVLTIRVLPAIEVNVALLALFVAGCFAVAYTALRYAPRWLVPGSLWPKLVASVIIAAAICALDALVMHTLSIAPEAVPSPVSLAVDRIALGHALAWSCVTVVAGFATIAFMQTRRETLPQVVREPEPMR